VEILTVYFLQKGGGGGHSERGERGEACPLAGKKKGESPSLKEKPEKKKIYEKKGGRGESLPARHYATQNY